MSTWRRHRLSAGPVGGVLIAASEKVPWELSPSGKGSLSPRQAGQARGAQAWAPVAARDPAGSPLGSQVRPGARPHTRTSLPGEGLGSGAGAVPQRFEPQLPLVRLVTTSPQVPGFSVRPEAAGPCVRDAVGRVALQGEGRAPEARTAAQRPGAARRSRALAGACGPTCPGRVRKPLSLRVPPDLPSGPPAIPGTPGGQVGWAGGGSRWEGPLAAPLGSVETCVGQGPGHRGQGPECGLGTSLFLAFPLPGAAWSAGAEGSPGPSRASCKSCHLFARLSPSLPLGPGAHLWLTALTDRRAHLPSAPGGPAGAEAPTGQQPWGRCGFTGRGRGPPARLVCPLTHTARVLQRVTPHHLASLLESTSSSSGKFWKDVEVRGSRGALSGWVSPRGQGGLCTVLSPWALLPQNSGLPPAVSGLAAP